MKIRTHRMRYLSIVSTGLTLISMGYSTSSQASDGACHNDNHPEKILKGIYSYQSTSVAFRRESDGSRTINTELGVDTFDGKGNIVNKYLSGGTGDQRFLPSIGTYTINEDCTGMSTYEDGTRYAMIVNPDGSGFKWVQINESNYSAGESTRISTPKRSKRSKDRKD
jgi:hypothetical protein